MPAYRDVDFVAKGLARVLDELLVCEYRQRRCLLYTSDDADEGLGVDLGGRSIIK